MNPPSSLAEPVVSLVHKAGGSRNGLQHFPVIKIQTVLASVTCLGEW